jgi:hypothetical protein
MNSSVQPQYPLSIETNIVDDKKEIVELLGSYIILKNLGYGASANTKLG